MKWLIVILLLVSLLLAASACKNTEKALEADTSQAKESSEPKCYPCTKTETYPCTKTETYPCTKLRTESYVEYEVYRECLDVPYTFEGWWPIDGNPSNGYEWVCETRYREECFIGTRPITKTRSVPYQSTCTRQVQDICTRQVEAICCDE